MKPPAAGTAEAVPVGATLVAVTVGESPVPLEDIVVTARGLAVANVTNARRAAVFRTDFMVFGGGGIEV